MKKVSLVNVNVLKIEFSYNTLTKDLVKGLDGRKWDANNKYWTLPVDLKALGSLDILKRAGFEVLDEVYTVLGDLQRREGKLEALANADSADFSTELPLLPYQRAGAEFLLEAGSAVLGDDVGLGKTIQTLAVIEARPEVKKVLVFCPAVLKYQWQAEIVKFLGQEFTDNLGNTTKNHKFVQVIDGNGAQRARQWADQWPYKYYLANYELLLRDFDFMELIKWDYIVADEATKISNPKSKTGKAIKQLKAKYRLALTGTLISNSPSDAWNIVDFTNPGVLGAYQEFMKRYTMPNDTYHMFGYFNLEDLANRLKRFMIRRMKVNVLKELPEKRIIDVPFKLSEEEHKLYDQIRQELLFEIERMDISKLENPTTIQLTIVKMLRLRQLADSMELLGKQEQSSKLDLLKELLAELAGNKIIIFTEFSEMAKILIREVGGLVISGDNNDNAKRTEIVAKFNADPNEKLLIMTSAGQFGLNIQAANVIIHYDQPWSLAKLTQREGRAWRYGQKQTVMVYNLLAKGTVDMYIQKKLFKKQEVSGQILGDPKPKMSEIKEMLMYNE